MTINNNPGLFEFGNWNEYNLNLLTSNNWRASLVNITAHADARCWIASDVNKRGVFFFSFWGQGNTGRKWDMRTHCTTVNCGDEPGNSESYGGSEANSECSRRGNARRIVKTLSAGGARRPCFCNPLGQSASKSPTIFFLAGETFNDYNRLGRGAPRTRNGVRARPVLRYSLAHARACAALSNPCLGG